MASSNVARLASVVVLLLSALALAVPVAAQSNQNITICEATGSSTTPYVFTTIDARDLPEHLARGDFQAGALADCAAAKPAATPAPGATPRAAAAPASSGVQQQGIGGVGLPSVPLSQVAPSPTATAASATATTTPARPSPTPAVAVSGAQATPEAGISALPRSGGEPDRPIMVLVLLGLIGAGFVLRR
jgi:hypothetical protein